MKGLGGRFSVGGRRRGREGGDENSVILLSFFWKKNFFDGLWVWFERFFGGGGGRGVERGRDVVFDKSVLFFFFV